MKIFFGADHNAEKQADELKSALLEFGEVFEPSDRNNWGSIVSKVGELISRNKDSFGVLVCGTGIGMCMVANKFKGVYASRCLSSEDASSSKIINNANTLCLSAQNSVEKNIEIIKKFFTTEYQDRKIQNIQEIYNLEDELMK